MKMKYDILVYGPGGKPRHTEVQGDVHPSGVFAARKTKEGWTVDHLPTGRKTVIFKTKTHAMKFIELAMAPDILPLFVLSDNAPDKIVQIYNEATK